MQFFDMDGVIEKKLSLSITEIFQKKGEKFFRKIEEEESNKIITKSGVVIALGGGAFMNGMIRDQIKKNSVSVWLDLDIDMIYKRTSVNKKRPLLENTSKENLKKLYEERKKVYLLADFKINCNLKNKNEIVNEIEKIYEDK